MSDFDKLCTQLRATEPYLDDRGFTAVVMAQLPRASELPTWIKNLILLGATLLGSAVVATQVPAGSLGSMLLALLTLDAQPLVAAVAQNLPVVLLGCFAISYLVPYGAFLAVRRGAI